MMKIIFKILLTILLIPTLLIVIISSTIRFQLLNNTFWQTTYSKHQTYKAVSIEIKKWLEDKTTKSGGNKKDIGALTNLVTEANTKDFVDKNINNTLNFINGNKNELLVYIPVSMVPNEEIPLPLLLSKFDINTLDTIPLSQINLVGYFVSIFFVISSSLVLFLLFGLYHLTDKGKKFFSISFSFIFVGLIIVFLFSKLPLITLTPEILKIVASPVISELERSLINIAGILFGIGVISILIKK